MCFTAHGTMATPRRQPLPKPSTEQEALRARLASITYSFAQQMPQPQLQSQRQQPHLNTSPNNSNSSLSRDIDDPNFPQLTSSQLTNKSFNSLSSSSPQPTSARAWNSSSVEPRTSSSPAKPPRWGNTSGKPATAAEVVAAKASDTTGRNEENTESAKHDAELELYSKLVPTTSSLPRNPGRSLGGGGLRATGSVATQNIARPGSATVLQSPQPLSSLPRKEPMTSRMRSLSSGTPKPQLARRVAKPSRSATSTPPPVQPQVGISESSLDSADAWKMSASGPKRLLHAQERKSELYVTPKDQVSDLSQGSALRTPGLNGTRRVDNYSHVRDIQVRDTPQHMTRRLDEAFSNANKYDPTTAPAPIATRKDQVNALRRSSVSSASSAYPPQRKPSGREAVNSHKSNPRTSSDLPSSRAPPGFERRPPTVTRSSLSTSRARPDSDSGHLSKARERESRPAPPPNARADALREALNSRRRSSSPRNPSYRRNSQNEACSGTNNLASAKVPPGKSSMEKEDFNGTFEKQTLRPTSLPVSHSRSSSSGSTGHTSSTPRLASLSRGHSRENSVQEDAVSRLIDSVSKQRAAFETNGSMKHVPKRNTMSSDFASKKMSEENAAKAFKERLSSQVTEGRHSFPLFPNEANGIKPSPIHFSRPSERVKTEQVCDSFPDKFPIPSATMPNGRMNGWDHRTNIDDIALNGGAEDVMSTRFAQDEFDSSSSTFVDVHKGVVFQEVSIPANSAADDFMRQLPHDGLATTESFCNERLEEVLPPLPDSEDVRFESMLRSMGWSPPDEDESLGESHQDGFHQAFRQEDPGNLGQHRTTTNRDNLGNRENGTVASAYYSHFQ